MIHVLWLVEVLVGRLFLLLKYFTLRTEEEMKPVQSGSSGAAISHRSSQSGMLRVVCFTNVHLILMPLQVQDFP